MQPKTLAVSQFAKQPVCGLNSFLMLIPVLICAAVVAAVLVAKLEAIGYSSGAVRPDPESVYYTLSVSP